MSRPALPLTAGAFLLTAAALTGCSASETPAAADGGCGLDQDGARAIVVQGAVDCGTLTGVWAAAVADPAFATHGNHNTIVVGQWTCRAHETAPILTGFCQDTGYRNKFKVVRVG